MIWYQIYILLHTFVGGVQYVKLSDFQRVSATYKTSYCTASAREACRCTKHENQKQLTVIHTVKHKQVVPSCDESISL